MPLSIGDQLGPYEILAPIGKGGMGEVWKARDLRLGRDVAIKMSLTGFDTRFRHEAQAVASLNHPHICTLYDVGPDYLVMEFIEGATLAVRISQGPLPLEEALAIAQQIADALAAAHEKHIVHRDLKPANIKIQLDGSVKVLDFGLAKTDGRVELNAESSTLTAMTPSGMILGTPEYMSPEQARGLVIDKRADIWAFGVVLYEMVTGRRPFRGATASDSLASILTVEPDLTSTPEKTRRLLASCLEKDPRKRLRDIGDWQLLLVEPAAAPALPAPKTSRAGWPWAAGAAVLVVALAALTLHFRQPPAETRSLQLQLNPPPGREFRPQDLALSPDGRMLAFVTGGPISKLWIRALDSPSARELPGTDGAFLPFWSPDQRSLGFFAGGKLKRVDLAGDRVSPIADAATGRGGSWNRDNVILFSAATNGPIWKVSALGGTVEPATTLDNTRESSHRFPLFLPDGQRFLFYVRSGEAVVQGIYLASLNSARDKTRVVETLFSGLYSPPRGTHPGKLLWKTQEGELIAQTFDVASGRMSDAPALVPEVGSLRGAYDRDTPVAVSNDGTLVYGLNYPRRQLTWYDRQGAAAGMIGEPDSYTGLRISPDGKRVLVARTDASGLSNVWTFDLAAGDWTRMTVGGGGGGALAWSPDGRRITHLAGGADMRATVFATSSTGGGTPERLTNTPHSQGDADWSPDGKFVLYRETSTEANYDLWVVPMTGARKPFPFLQTAFQEFGGRFSPDGKWVSYTSNESGRQEICVRSFPAGPTKQQVSLNGGSNSVWRRDGQELFYRSPEGNLMAVPIESVAGSLRFGSPKILFPMPSDAYDVTVDGRRFLLYVPSRGLDSEPLTVLLNWQEKLNRQH